MAISSALVVDDSKSARYSLRKMLEKMDVSVAFAESGEQALESLGDSQPDVIFMDHMMPGMDGLEATQAIKNNPAWAGIPVVMCTSKDGDEYAAEAKSHGAIGVLPKPATLKQITEILDSLEQLAALMPETSVAEEEPAAVLSGEPTPVDQIETLVQNAVEAAVAKAVQSTVTPLVQEQVQSQLESQLTAQLSSQLEKQLPDYISRAGSELLSSALAETKVACQQLIDEALVAERSNIMAEVQASVQAQLQGLASQDAETEAKFQELLAPVSAELTQLQEKMATPTSATITSEQLHEIKQAAKAEATQEANRIAEETTSSTQKLAKIAKEQATQVTQQLLDNRSASQENQREQVSDEINASMQSLSSRLYLLFGLAAGIGIAAAAVVFAIK
ncbi:response regulator [Endozoicomonas sp. SM1973]|uniref:Response regulator n=1 Tax=Spartinivicinus marinus TaxID=2994442 RepID=A0A853I2T8_9GAMM|nr:response regulator [Spartinivicinus marinus]MCX4029700.1 response regulator [Spartinivicinus marinus]NYZ66919.1 response regulator [Spartinivicinus marinus]